MSKNSTELVKENPFNFNNRENSNEVIEVKNLFPKSEFEFIDNVHVSVTTIKKAFKCYMVDSFCDFFNHSSLKEAMQNLENKMMVEGGWLFEDPNKAVSIDIRKINIDKTLSELEVFAEFYSFQQKSNEIIRNFKKSILVDEQYYLLPFISGVLCCPDKHGDYLVFEYEDELYILSMLCYI